MICESFKVVTLISANVEWRAFCAFFPNRQVHTSPLGEWFQMSYEISGAPVPVIMFHGGWGKIAAAASTQFLIDCWKPSLIINLGTCGGFEGKIKRGTIVLADRTVVYDIHEQMGDYEEHLAHYTTVIDLRWLPESLPQAVQRTLLVSADRDLIPAEILDLYNRFGAVAGDWESGAIAYVAARNQVRLLILRGVTDLVGETGGEVYGNLNLFEDATRAIFKRLLDSFPAWISTGLSMPS